VALARRPCRKAIRIAEALPCLGKTCCTRHLGASTIIKLGASTLIKRCCYSGRGSHLGFFVPGCVIMPIGQDSCPCSIAARNIRQNSSSCSRIRSMVSSASSKAEPFHLNMTLSPMYGVLLRLGSSLQTVESSSAPEARGVCRRFHV